MFGVWQTWPLIVASVVRKPAGLEVTDLEQFGQLGDSYGALNAGMAALAFAGVLVTIIIQMALSQVQANQKHKEQFEARFFQLLELARSLRGEVRFSHSDEYLNHHNLYRDDHPGFPSFAAMHREFVWHLQGWHAGPDLKKDRAALGELYRKVIHEHSEATIGPYFRILYTILRRVDEDELLSKAEKHAYWNLVRSQITSAELSVAGLNGLFRESANFSYFLEKARMFKYMPYNSVKAAISPHYWSAAFLGRDEDGRDEPPKQDSLFRVRSTKPWLEHN